MTPPHFPSDRRRFLRHGARLALGAGALAAATVHAAQASDTADRGQRLLAMAHTHTGETLELAYAQGPLYLPEALGTLNHFLRDHYSGEVGRIDPRLFDLLHRLRLALGSNAEYEVISGYRCPATNQRLRSSRGGGVARRSLHMDGQAIDLRLRGTALGDLRDAALSLRGGGVGFYPRDRFVHLDTGRVRRW